MESIFQKKLQYLHWITILQIIEVHSAHGADKSILETIKNQFETFLICLPFFHFGRSHQPVEGTINSSDNSHWRAPVSDTGPDTTVSKHRHIVLS